jgi:hypothetical protein
VSLSILQNKILSNSKTQNTFYLSWEFLVINSVDGELPHELCFLFEQFSFFGDKIRGCSYKVNSPANFSIFIEARSICSVVKTLIDSLSIIASHFSAQGYAVLTVGNWLDHIKGCSLSMGVSFLSERDLNRKCDTAIILFPIIYALLLNAPYTKEGIGIQLSEIVLPEKGVCLPSFNSSAGFKIEDYCAELIDFSKIDLQNEHSLIEIEKYSTLYSIRVWDSITIGSLNAPSIALGIDAFALFSSIISNQYIHAELSRIIQKFESELLFSYLQKIREEGLSTGIGNRSMRAIATEVVKLGKKCFQERIELGEETSYFQNLFERVSLIAFEGATEAEASREKWFSTRNNRDKISLGINYSVMQQLTKFIQ